jgi:hypothetical protein
MPRTAAGYVRMYHKLAESLHDRIWSSRCQCCAGLAMTAPACFPRRRDHRRRRGLAPHAAVTVFFIAQRRSRGPDAVVPYFRISMWSSRGLASQQAVQGDCGGLPDKGTCVGIFRADRE